MQLSLGIEVLLLLRHLHDVAQGTHSTGHDGDLLHGLRVLLHCTDQGVADFVVGDNGPLLLAHDAVLLLLADQNLLDGFEEVLLVDIFALVLDCVDGSFVDHVGEVGAHCSAGRQRDLFQIHGLVHADVLGVYFQNFDSALEVGSVHDDPSVKAAGTKQRLIQDLRPVGRADDQDTLGRLKSVHLGEQLVQGLFSLLVAAAVLGIAAPADGVDLVDKNDAGRVLVGLLEEVTHTGSAYAYVQFDKVGSRQGEEGHVRFSCYGLGEQCFARSGRTDQERPLGELGADLDVLAGIVQEIDNFLQRFLGFILARDILECDACILLHIFLGRALSDAAHEAAAAGSSENESHDHPQEYDGQHIGQQEGYDHTRAVRDIAVDRDARLEQTLSQRSRLLRDRRIAKSFGVLEMDLQAVRPDVDFLHFSVLDHLHKFIVADLGGRLGASVHHIADHDKGDHGRKEHDHKVLAVGPLAAVSLLIVAATAAAGTPAVSPVVVVALDIAAEAVFLMEKISKHSYIHLFLSTAGVKILLSG